LNRFKEEPVTHIWVVGSANMDLVLPVGRIPRAGETISGGDLALIPGGKGANQACAAGRLGAAVSMIAQVGEDAFGSALIRSLEAAGVDAAGVGRASLPTGCALIYVLPDGENSIVLSPGANAALDAATATARLGGLAPGDFVLLQLEIPLETVGAVAHAARTAGATTVLDPAPGRSLPPSLLRLMDYITPNQTEAAVLLGEPGNEIRGVSEAADAAAKLAQLSGAAIAIKLGRLGCFILSDTASAHIPAFPIEAVDATAAGDVFNAALAAGLSEGRPLTEAARFANAAAAISVTRRGAQSSIPDRAEVEAFLRRAAGGEEAARCL
jgi:ribokinase